MGAFGIITTGALAAGGLYALGKSMDDKQTRDFVFAIDGDIENLLVQANIFEISAAHLFSRPAQNGSLNKSIDSIQLRILREDGVYKRVVIIKVEVNGVPKDFNAERTYDIDYLPVAITTEMIKSSKACLEWVVYQKANAERKQDEKTSTMGKEIC